MNLTRRFCWCGCSCFAKFISTCSYPIIFYYLSIAPSETCCCSESLSDLPHWNNQRIHHHLAAPSLANIGSRSATFQVLYVNLLVRLFVLSFVRFACSASLARSSDSSMLLYARCWWPDEDGDDGQMRGNETGWDLYWILFMVILHPLLHLSDSTRIGGLPVTGGFKSSNNQVWHCYQWIWAISQSNHDDCSLIKPSGR